MSPQEPRVSRVSDERVNDWCEGGTLPWFCYPEQSMRDVFLDLRDERAAHRETRRIAREALLAIRMTDCPNVDCDCCPEHDAIAGTALAALEAEVTP